MREANALEQVLTCLYLAEALAGVNVGLINTFLSPKSPRCSQRQSDTQVRVSRFFVPSEPCLIQVFFHFLGQQAANAALLEAECLVTALITPGPPRCAWSLGNPRT